jgi:hypothetical protein
VAAVLAFKVDLDPDVWILPLRMILVLMLQTSGVEAHGAVLVPDGVQWVGDE